MPMIDPAIEEYADRSTTPAPPALAALEARARRELPYESMISGVVVGRLLETLVFAAQPQLVLEIGTYAGTSALWMAGALPPGGRLITCEFDETHADFAQAAFDASPHGDRIELRRGPALETLATLDGPFGLVFVDADKESYPDYLRAVLPKLAPRGLIVADNTLRDGGVLRPDEASEGTAAILEFNAAAVSDPGLVATLLTVRDGVTVIRRA